METAFSVCRNVPGLAREAAGSFWPGPLTLVLGADKTVPETVTAGTGTVGIRVPGPSLALDLAGSFPGPLTATSANRAGYPPPSTIDKLDPALVSCVDLLVDGGLVQGGLPSTLLDLTTDPPRIIRHGVLGDEVMEWLVGQGV